MQKPKKLSVFDLLKQNTTFRQKPEEKVFKNQQNPAIKKATKPSKPKKVKPEDPEKYRVKDSESELEEDGIFHSHEGLDEEAKHEEEP